MTRKFNMHKWMLQSHKYCQRLFYYAVIVKIPTEFVPKPMQEGRDFHEHSAEFYDLVDLREDPSFEYFRSLLPRGTDINGLYDNYAEFEYQRMVSILNQNLDPWDFFLPIVKELSIVLDDHMMAGTIDRIYRLDDGHPCIFEVKPKLPKARTSLRRELAFYTYLCNHYEPLYDEWGPFEYIGGYGYRTNKMWYEKIKSRTMDALFNSLDIVDYNISTRKDVSEWPRNIYARCDGCGYQYQCWTVDKLEMPPIRKEEQKWKRAK